MLPPVRRSQAALAAGPASQSHVPTSSRPGNGAGLFGKEEDSNFTPLLKLTPAVPMGSYQPPTDPLERGQYRYDAQGAMGPSELHPNSSIISHNNPNFTPPTGPVHNYNNPFVSTFQGFSPGAQGSAAAGAGTATHEAAGFRMGNGCVGGAEDSAVGGRSFAVTPPEQSTPQQLMQEQSTPLWTLPIIPPQSSPAQQEDFFARYNMEAPPYTELQPPPGQQAPSQPPPADMFRQSGMEPPPFLLFSVIPYTAADRESNWIPRSCHRSKSP